MKPKISIIVPIYKSERYLSRCIDSILAQTFTNFELILVNDGSPDNCANLCDEYAKKDKRIVVIHKENGGVSSARNTGLGAALGQYIGFVDSDDYIHEKMYELLYEHAFQHSSDMVVCDFLKVTEHTNTQKKLNKSTNLIHFTNIQALNQLYSVPKEKEGMWVYPVNKIYKKKLFDNLRYREGKIYEDEYISHQILYKCRKVTFVSEILYYYYQRPDSITGSPFGTQKFDRVYALRERVDFFRSKKKQQLHNQALKHLTEVFFWYYIKAQSDFGNINKELKELKKTLDGSVYYLLKNPLFSWKQKVFLLMFWINPSIIKINQKRMRLVKMFKEHSLEKMP